VIVLPVETFLLLAGVSGMMMPPTLIRSIFGQSSLLNKKLGRKIHHNGEGDGKGL
jgi:hypothetical protein